MTMRTCVVHGVLLYGLSVVLWLVPLGPRPHAWGHLFAWAGVSTALGLLLQAGWAGVCALRALWVQRTHEGRP
jgi:hypothetical protein